MPQARAAERIVKCERRAEGANGVPGKAVAGGVPAQAGTARGRRIGTRVAVFMMPDLEPEHPMRDSTTELSPTDEISIHAMTAARAITLIRAAEELIDDMHHQVDAVEAVCAATRARIGQRRAGRVAT